MEWNGIQINYMIKKIYDVAEELELSDIIEKISQIIVGLMKTK